MRKGTTPVFNFELKEGFDPNTIAKAKFMMRQGNTKLIKFLAQGKLKENCLSWKLSQQETLLFKENIVCSVQLQVVTTTGDSLVSDVYQIFILDYLDDEVLE